MIAISKKHWKSVEEAKPRRCYTNIFPPLTPEAYDSLKRSIAEIGVQEPVIEDEEGGLIDGRHRQRACDELGITCPRIVRQFANEAEKFELALQLNCQRRQLSRKQKRDLIEAYLLADPAIADNALADIIGGLSKNTVADVRAKLEATCQIDKLVRTRGKDGKERPRRYTIVANTAREVKVAQKALKNLPPSCDGKILDTTTAARRARHNVQRQVRTSREAKPFGDGNVQLYYCRFQELEEVAGLQAESANLLLTDIPYGRQFLDQLPELAVLAQRVLVDGGLLVTYSGQFFLDQVMEAFSRHLTYRWIIASVSQIDATPVHPLDITSKWKPILVFSRGDWKRRGRWVDLSNVTSKEKDWHPWQQPLAEADMLVRYFSQPGDLVVDSCGGSFTTAVACKRLGRRFIGCDVDEECVLTGWERLAQEKA